MAIKTNNTHSRKSFRCKLVRICREIELARCNPRCLYILRTLAVKAVDNFQSFKPDAVHNLPGVFFLVFGSSGLDCHAAIYSAGLRITQLMMFTRQKELKQ